MPTIAKPSFIKIHRTWLLLAAIILLGAVLRFQAISTTVVTNPIWRDAQVYYFAGLNLEHWGIFSRAAPGNAPPKPDAFVQPGLPYAITPFIEFPPTDRMLFRINTVQAILSVLTVLLTFGFFKLFASNTIALGAALLTAISPHLVVMTTYLLTETLFTFLLAAGMLSLAWGQRRDSIPWAVVAGILLGLSALTRATTEYLPLFMLPLLYWAMNRRDFLRVAVPAAVTALAVIVTWKLRNLFATGMLADPTLMVSALHAGMYPDFMFNGDPESFGYPYRFDPFSEKVTGITSVIAELFYRAKQAPTEYASWYLIGKPIFLLSWNMIEGIGDVFIYPISASPYLDQPLFQVTRRIAWFIHLPLSFMAVLGSAIAVAKPEWLGLKQSTRFPAIMVAMLIAYFFAIHLVGAPFPRYGIPLRPFVYGFGLFSMVALACSIRAKSRMKADAQ